MAAADRSREAGMPVPDEAAPPKPQAARGNQASLRQRVDQARPPVVTPVGQHEVCPQEDREDELEEGADAAAAQRKAGALPASDPPPADLPAKPPTGNSGLPGNGPGGPQSPLAAAVNLARADGGAPLPLPARGLLERAFGRDLGSLRLHGSEAAAALVHGMGARAVTLGRDVFLGSDALAGYQSDLFLITHEVTHALQQDLQPDLEPQDIGARGTAAEQEAEDAAWMVRLGLPLPPLRREPHGTLRRDEPRATAATASSTPAPVASPAVIEAFLAHPPALRMFANMDGLSFSPADGGVTEFPDLFLGPTASIIARLADVHYTPTMVRDFQATPQALTWVPSVPGGRQARRIMLRPSGAADLLGFLDQRLGVANVAISAHQRSVVLTAQAFNPIPEPILAAVRQFMVVGGTPEVEGLLGGNSDMVKRLAPIWWDRTQAYVQKWLAWRAGATPDTTYEAASALDELLSEFSIYSRLLRLIYEDHALQLLPEWQILWPNGRGGVRRAVTEYAQTAVLEFVGFASSQPRPFLRLARTDAAARRSLLLGFAAMRGSTVSAAAGDQQVSPAPSPYNAPPLPMQIDAFPSLIPPNFGTVLGTTTTFVGTIQFQSFFEGMSHAVGGWFYQWDYVRVPNDDPAQLGLQSVQPLQASEMDALRARLSHEVDYAAEDLQRFNIVDRMAMQLGAPGVGPETLVGFNLLAGVLGSGMRSLFSVLATPSREYRVTPSEEGLYIARCLAGPRLSDDPVQAQFRRQPSAAWMPFWAMPAARIARNLTEMQDAARASSESRYRELARLLETTCTVDDAAARRELEQLRVTLHGSGLEVLEAQKAALEDRQREIRRTGVTSSDELTAIARQIADLDLMIGMRRNRAAMLGGARVIRPQATLVTDEGNPIGLLIEAAQHRSGRPLWHVADTTTPNSGIANPEPGPGTLAPGFPNEDAILATLKALLEGESGYGRGQLAVRFPPNLDRTDQEPGNLWTIRIAQSRGQIAIHAIENVATLASIAAVVAAPFTGGASLAIMMPVGIVGALPSAYRLVHRAEMGTLRNDLATWMAVVDIAGAAINLGEIGAGARAAANAGTRAGLRWALLENGLWIAGIGGNGLGMVLMARGMLDQLEQLRGLPPGVAAARSMEIIGNVLLSLGIQAGAHMASRGHVHAAEEGLRSTTDTSGNRTAPTVVPTTVDLPAPGTRPRGRSEPSAELAAAIPPNARVPLDVDTTGAAVRGNGVRVEFRIDPRTRRVDADSIRMVAGSRATPADIAAHVETVRTLRAYAGALGAVLEATEALRAAAGAGRRAAQGSTAWEAEMELAKLPPIIDARMRELRSLTSEDPRRLQIEDDIANLMDQVDYAQALVRGMVSAGPEGFIAARSTEDLRANNLEAVRTDSIMVVSQSGGQWTARSAADVVAAGADPAPGHYIATHTGRPVIRWARARTDGASPRYRLMREAGQWYLVPHDYAGAPIRRPDGGDVTLTDLPRDFASRLARAAAASPHTAASFPVLETALTEAGLPSESPVRPLLREWGNALNQIEVIRQASEGRNLPTSLEITRQAAAALMRNSDGGAVIEARVDEFRRFMRDQALSAIFGIPREDLARGTRADGTPLSARPGAEQMAFYRDLVARMPESGDIGELWTRYRTVRSALPVASGGIGTFVPLAISTRRLVHNPVTEVDGAITVSAQLTDGPPPGNYGLESKGGRSYKPEQAGRYSDHLTVNDGHLVLDGDSKSLSGIIYMCDTAATALTARDNLDSTGRHRNIYVLYLDTDGRLRVMPRGVHRAASATTAAPAAGPSASGSGAPP